MTNHSIERSARIWRGTSAGRRRDRFTSRSMAAARFVAQRWILKPLVWSLTTVTVIDRAKVDALRGPFIAVANHTSHLDAPLILGALARRHARYLAVGAAGDYFFDVRWRRGLTALFFNAFPVDRGQRTEGSRRRVKARTLVERGVPILLFPEGTRSRTGEPGAFKPGAAALAVSCDVPCLPVALIGAHLAHPRGSNWPKPGRLPAGVVFGDPLRAHPDETAVEFTARIKAEVVRLHDSNAPRILGRAAATEGALP